jgi:hypothetical protein
VHFFLPFYPCYYLALSFYSCTYWVPTISVLNLAIFPGYSKLLLRRWRWTEILRWGVLDYVSPWLSFLWSYGVFRCSVSLRVILVFRDIIYVIIVLYSWHLIIREHFLSVCVKQLILGIHTMSTWFWHKNRVWHRGRLPFRSWARPASPVHWTASWVSAHGAKVHFKSFPISRFNLNLFQTSKIHSKFIACPKIMKPILLFI